ncbi:MAG: hypothetical protein OXH37_09780 [Gammaproteobacteria bacterium]|nr:hypothetical protein [Gammaproteobacteria bacterium]
MVFANLRDGTPKVTFHIQLTDEDEQLISLWRRKPSNSGTDENQRLQAARKAEKAALEYYSGIGNQVDDVSIQQLHGRSGDWERFDLRAAGRPLDVKNVRCAREDRFAEFHWKKQKRDGGLDIPIVGVVWMEDSENSVVVGELDRRELSEFRKLVDTHQAEFQVLAEGRDRLRFIPGWLLEYPEDHYRSMPDWENLTERWLNISRDLEVDPPHWILALMSSRLPSLSDRSIKTPLLHEIQEHFQHFGVSRKTVFWLVLLHMLSRVENPNFAAIELTRHLFPNAEGCDKFPLGCVDPRRYVWTLIQTLKRLIEANSEILREVSKFRLLGLGILQAETHGQWRTILAYCGDCGKSPIFLGAPDAAHQPESRQSGHCQSCPCDQRRLVCDKCGSCSGKNCSERGIAYESWGEVSRAAKQYPNWTVKGLSLFPPSGRASGPLVG